MPIFDQGYQHWSGQLSGHAGRWLAITRHGLRVGLAGKGVRILLLAAFVPALMLAFVLSVWGLLERQSDLITSIMPMLGFLDPEILAAPRAYRVEVWTLSYNYFLATQLLVAMILILTVGPNLISQDLRYNALPLYFSRPLRRIDYCLGKLGVIVGLLVAVIILPAIAAYMLGLAFSLDLSILRDTFGILMASIGYGLVIALSAGLLMLALSSLSRNSRYVALFWIGIWIVTTAVSTVLQEMERENRMQQAGWNVSGADVRAAARRDWRPLVSYTANLQRVGEHLLGTHAAWERFGKLQPAGRRDEFMLAVAGPQFPWYWSATVLVVLFGLSVCTLSFTIKSLDRLK